MSTLFGGGTAVLLEVFDAGRSLRAIAQHRVEILGQIPAMFNLEWMLKDYDRYDLSSLKFAAYGGNAVSRPFRGPACRHGAGDRHRAGAHRGRRFLHLCSGECGRPSETILAGLGQDMPIYPCTIRQPMRDDGNAGDELPAGEIGHVCFRGPQTFLGYVNDPAATATDDFARRLFIYRRSWLQGRRGLASDRPGEVGDQVAWLPDLSRRCGSAHLQP